MQNWIRQLSPNVEFVFVIAICFGYFIYISLQSLVVHSGNTDEITDVVDDRGLIEIMVIEVSALLLTAFFLKERGWGISDFPLKVSWQSTLGGFLLFIIDYGLYYFIYNLVSYIAGGSQIFNYEENYDDVGLISQAMICIVNSVFEEFIVVGYVFTSLEVNHETMFAVGMSTFIRLLYHFYQGPIALVSIIPQGILFALVYWQWKALWPLIFAHGLSNFFSYLLSKASQDA